MYVCVCNAISDRDVETAKIQGAQSEKQVFRHFGVEAQCGRCVESIGGLVKCRFRKTESAVLSEENTYDIKAKLAVG